jgi:hypothetical protein
MDVGRNGHDAHPLSGRERYMKRIVLLGIVALALAIGLPSVARAAENDVNGPACADIVSGDGSYSLAGDVTVNLGLAAPSCSFVTYTVYVLDGSCTNLVTSTSMKGDGTSSLLTLIANVNTAANPAVCIYATTSVGPHVFDRAPDSGYPPPMNVNSGPGFGSFD